MCNKSNGNIRRIICLKRTYNYKWKHKIVTQVGSVAQCDDYGKNAILNTFITEVLAVQNV